MWRGDLRKTDEQNAKTAKEYYKEKYGATPNQCYIHGSSAEDVPDMLGMTTSKTPWVRPHHIMMGRKGD